MADKNMTDFEKIPRAETLKITEIEEDGPLLIQKRDEKTRITQRGVD
jgi:hypothetical protein